MSESRKATDVILELETMVISILDLVRSQDLSNKIISNKLNDVIARLDKQQKITVEAVQNIPLPPASFPVGDPERAIPFSVETALPQDNSPQGFRRNSRPETYMDDRNNFPSYESNPPVPKSEAIVPPEALLKKSSNPPPPLQVKEVAEPIFSGQGQIPVMQRCVDKNGKSIFLADVSIIDLATNQQVTKTRTSGMGKWMAALAVGNYRVEIRKQGSSLKEKIEAVQDIQVDGRASKLDLPMLIIK